MNEKKDAIIFHRQQMYEWLEVQKDAKWRGDVETEQYAIEQYREHRDALQALWASPAEQLVVCI
ncbi:hypothetical protein BJP48_31520 [Paenibacillus odorifer]|nr:hypothetical protein BJP48_31520 [Paenibacillus odorifer]